MAAARGALGELPQGVAVARVNERRGFIKCIDKLVPPLQAGRIGRQAVGQACRLGKGDGEGEEHGEACHDILEVKHLARGGQVVKEVHDELDVGADLVADGALEVVARKGVGGRLALHLPVAPVRVEDAGALDTTQDGHQMRAAKVVELRLLHMLQPHGVVDVDHAPARNGELVPRLAQPSFLCELVEWGITS